MLGKNNMANADQVAEENKKEKYQQNTYNA